MKQNSELKSKVSQQKPGKVETHKQEEVKAADAIDEGIKVGGKIQVTLHCDQVSAYFLFIFRL